jgi:hypothetical protein
MSTEIQPTYITLPELLVRWAGIYTEAGLRSWAQHPHRGPERAFPKGVGVAAFTLAAVEEFERTNPRFLVRKAKLAAKTGGAQ